MGSLFGNFSQQEQHSQQNANSGFSPQFKDSASDFTINRLVGLSDGAEDLLRNHALPQFQFSQTTPGLFKEQEDWAQAFANQLFNKVSGSAAARGQLSPFNVPAVVGSALTKAAPTILPLIGQNLQNAMVVPETIRTQRFQNAMSPLQALIAGLGSSSSGGSAGSGFGVGGGLSLGAGDPMSAGTLFGSCWIAERFYGKQDVRTHILRAWFKGRPTWWVSKLYAKYGKWAAKQWWCELLRPLFAVFLHMAVADMAKAMKEAH